MRPDPIPAVQFPKISCNGNASFCGHIDHSGRYGEILQANGDDQGAGFCFYGEVVAGILVSGPTHRMTIERIERI